MKDQVGIYVAPGNWYIWRIAKAVAKAQGISLSELAARAVKDYCINHQLTEDEVIVLGWSEQKESTKNE